MKSAPQNESRCAPPSELPAITSGRLDERLDHGLPLRARRRGEHELHLRGRRRATGRGTRRAGPCPAPRAMSHTVRPTRPLVLGSLHRLDGARPATRTRTSDRWDRRSPCASGRAPPGRAAARDRRGSGSVSVSRNAGISSNRNVESSEKCAPCRLVANIGCTVEAVVGARSCANSRLRDQPSGACGSSVSVLRCTGRPDARAIASTSSRSASS